MQILRKIYRQTVLTLAAAGLLSTLVMAHAGSGIAVDRLGQVYFLDTDFNYHCDHRSASIARLKV